MTNILLGLCLIATLIFSVFESCQTPVVRKKEVPIKKSYEERLQELSDRIDELETELQIEKTSPPR